MDIANLLPTSLTISPLNIFWSLIAIYVVTGLASYSIFVYKLAKLPTHPNPRVIYSVVLSIIRGDAGVFRDFIESHEHYFQENGYTVIWFFFIPFLMIGRYDRAQELVGAPATLDKGYPFVATETFFGQGIISSKASKWRSRRRLVRQQFSTLSVTNYVDSIRSIAKDVNKSIDQAIVNEVKTGKPLDARGLFSVPTMQMVVGKATGVKLDKKEYSFLCHAMEKFLHEIDIKIFFLPFYFNFIHEIYLKFSGVREMINKTDEILISAIRTKYNQIKDGLQVTSVNSSITDQMTNGEHDFNLNDLKDVASYDESKRADSLSELLLRTWIHPETGLTKQIELDILEELKSVIVAGSDGPDSLMTWFLCILGCYPEYQEKIYDEVKAADTKDWTMSTVNNCAFLDQCYKEATRLYTAAPVKIRRAEKDQMVDGKIIPKNTLILVSLFTILHDPKIFPEPFEYKPERFDPNAKPKIPTGAYIPFGLSPRDCVGQRLATFHIKFVIGSIIRSFKIKSHRHWKDIEYKVSFVFKPSNQIDVSFTRR